jgi:hypothetical protein
MRITRDQSFDENYPRCIEQLNWALGQLGGKVDEGQVAHISELIMQTMTGTWRTFHTPEHIFDVGRSGDGVEVLSALFHDAIHIQADNGVSVNVGLLVAPFIRESHKTLKILSAQQLPTDPVFEMICGVFGFVPEQTLSSSNGQNEFLSAVVAGKCLEGALSLETITQIVACIEATIPFRSLSVAGQMPSEQLRTRLVTANIRFGFGWSQEQLDAVVKRAVRLANRDVENFAHPSAAEFLNNTWNLMPETNHDLLGAYAYTVSGYRKSLQKMERFMSGLTAPAVFRMFQDEPETAVFDVILARTQKNLEVARLYLGSKLLSIAIIEAVSLRLGTEVPLATMMGELPQHGSLDAQLESFLPHVSMVIQPSNKLEWEVLDLLEKGRTQESDYDVKHSPVATYVIKSIGFVQANRLLDIAREFFDEKLSGEEFLHVCSREIVETIVTGVQKIFEVRSKVIGTVPQYN